MPDVLDEHEIFSGYGSLENFFLFLEREERNISGLFILTDTTTGEHCYPLLSAGLEGRLGAPCIITVNEGEKTKNIISCYYIWDQLLQKKADRSSILVNLGGGMITDLGGFVASVYKRGMPFINIPTSLMGQVDASIGGKTGINFGGYKNQLGLFQLPKLVIIDPSFLKTLPRREYNSAFPELLKYALISNPSWETLLQNEFPDKISPLDDSIKIIEELINLSVRCKLHFVKDDLRDEGKRRALNFGHTIAHALEAFWGSAGNNALLHGEAVGIGIIAELYYSQKVLGFPGDMLDGLAGTILEKTGKRRITQDIGLIMGLLEQDKKNAGGKVLFTLLEKPGSPVPGIEVSKSLIQEGMEYYNMLADDPDC